MKILVVGGSAVSGQAAIAAGLELGAEVISTSSGNSATPGAHRTLPGIDLAAQGAAEKIIQELKGQNLNYIVYIPARGEVGVPARQASKAELEKSLSYSVIPFLKLHRALAPRRTIALSGFITMDPMLLIYGTMTFTKIAMEGLAIRHPKELQVLRIGMFLSKSVRGIALLVQRNMQQNLVPELADLRREWKNAGGRFSDFLWQKNYRYEEEVYKAHAGGKPFRPTTADDLKQAFQALFAGVEAPIYNLLGAWNWTEKDMPVLPSVVAENISLIPDNLDRYLLT